MVKEELLGSFRGNGVEFFVDRDADAELALAHAERAAQFRLVADIVLGNQALEGLDDLTGTLHMAGRADTNGNSHIHVSFSYKTLKGDEMLDSDRIKPPAAMLKKACAVGGFIISFNQKLENGYR